jgi:hypothetical protein
LLEGEYESKEKRRSLKSRVSPSMRLLSVAWVCQIHSYDRSNNLVLLLHIHLNLKSCILSPLLLSFSSLAGQRSQRTNWTVLIQVYSTCKWIFVCSFHFFKLLFPLQLGQKPLSVVKASCFRYRSVHTAFITPYDVRIRKYGALCVCVCVCDVCVCVCVCVCQRKT